MSKRYSVTIDRALYMLEVAANYITEYCPDAHVEFEDSDGYNYIQDGYSVVDDCRESAAMLKIMVEKEG